MKYFSMFSGIGGFEKGIQQAYELVENATSKDTRSSKQESKSRGRFGEHATCVGYSEIDKYAIKVYERHFKHDNYGDATAINPTDLPDFDLLVGGFPCQAFSIAGKRQGFADTRGTLFFDIARILSEKRPRHLVLENVKGLLSHDSGKTFQTILGVLSDLGYFVEWQVLNSKDFGVPQNRERVYIVGHLGNECRGKVFPISGNSPKTIEQGLITVSAVTGVKDVNLSPTLDTMYKKGLGSKQARPGVIKRQPLRYLDRNQKNYDGDYSFTVDASQTSGIRVEETLCKGSGTSFERGTISSVKIRRLTPKECERLQGFPDDWTKYGVLRKWNDWKNQVDYEPISDTQRYKMCGNAVTVNTVQAVIERLIPCL